MTKINIIFEDALDDADIIIVPDEIADRIEDICQEFLDWVPAAQDDEYYTLIDGEKCFVAETDGFIKWLNFNYCKKSQKAYVLQRNTNYCPEYKSIEF